MSKRMKRFSFSVLISLAVVAGVYTSVLGASLHAGTRHGQVHVNAGLMFDVSHQRHAVQKLDVYLPQIERSSHECNGDKGINPSDY